MRVCFLTLGTRGDVQPYLALAKYIINKGHSAIICTSESFKNLVKKEGVEFASAALDLMALSQSDIGKKVLEHPIKNIKLTLKVSKEIMRPQYRQTFDDFYNACKNADIIVYHSKALVAIDIAEKLHIPAVHMPPIPVIQPITEFPSIAISSNQNFGGFINKMTYASNTKSDSGFIKEINDFRDKTLLLPERKPGEYTYYYKGNKIPIVYPISNYLFKHVSSWKNEVFLSGFFFLNENTELSEEVQNFIIKGAKPIIVSFSSMPISKPEIFIDNLLNALKKTGNRAVILKGSGGINLENSDNIYVVESLPHIMLFEKSKGVIHHGGVGTTAAALLAGIPQMIIPFSVDQPFWAKCMFENGVATEPIKQNELNEQKLIQYLQEMDNPKMIDKAKKLSEIIKKEEGLEKAYNYLMNLT